MKTKAKLMGIALTALSAPALADDFRLKTEYYDNSSREVRSTIGIAPEGAYEGAPTSVKGNFFEYFRLYDIHANGTDYIAAGTRLPQFKLSNIENNVLLFGSTGDLDGAGIETNHKIGKYLLTLNAETLNGNTQRLGLGSNYQLTDKTNLGLGIDTVEIAGERTNQYLVNSIIDFSDKDTVGLVAVLRELPDDTTDKSIGGMYIYYSDSWGVRARSRFDWNEDHDFKSYSGEIILAENPTTPKLGATWIVGRSANSDEMYNLSVVPLSVSKTEAVRLQDRALSGISATVRGSYVDIQGIQSGFVAEGLGYTIPATVLGGKLGLATELIHNFRESDDSTTVQSSIVYRKGNLDLESNVGIPLEDQNHTTIGVGLQVRF